MAKRLTFRRIRGRIVPIIRDFIKGERRGGLFSRPSIRELRSSKRETIREAMNSPESVIRSLMANNAFTNIKFNPDISPARREINTRIKALKVTDFAITLKGQAAIGPTQFSKLAKRISVNRNPFKTSSRIRKIRKNIKKRGNR